MTSENKKICIACGSAIPEQAEICTECKSYQARWKNSLRYLASVIGVITLFFSALTFIISSLPEVKKVVAWQDEIMLLAFSTGKPITIANVGDGDVFVTHINMSEKQPSDIRYSSTERIGEIVEVGKIVTIDSKNAASIGGGDYRVAYATDQNEIDELLKEAKLASAEDACVQIRFTIPNDSGYLTFKEFLGEKMITFEVEAYVRFFSFEKQAYVDQEIPMLGYLVLNQDSKCVK